MKFRKNYTESEQSNASMRELNESKEYEYINDTYRRIKDDILLSSQSSMLFIPFSDWISSFDETRFVDKRNDEMENLVVTLKDKLRSVAQSEKYTYEDHNGFLIRT